MAYYKNGRYSLGEHYFSVQQSNRTKTMPFLSIAILLMPCLFQSLWIYSFITANGGWAPHTTAEFQYFISEVMSYNSMCVIEDSPCTWGATYSRLNPALLISVISKLYRIEHLGGWESSSSSTSSALNVLPLLFGEFLPMLEKFYTISVHWRSTWTLLASVRVSSIISEIASEFSTCLLRMFLVVIEDEATSAIRA